MAQSQNSTVDLTIRATSFAGLGTYGNVLVGNAAFEFYNERNPEDFIQIPWDEVEHISAEVIGRKIVRFAIFVKGGNHFSFSTRDNKATLRAVRAYVPEDHMYRSPSFLQVVKAGLLSIPRSIAGLFGRRGNKDA